MSEREPWEKHPWEEGDHPIWDEVVKTPGWPECGDGSISVESLYQAFKQRLMAELVAERPAAPILGYPDFVAAAELYKLVEIK